eukprot:scaffold4741_cov376-Prasinococcus_capsulatus_cf.AAC.1
MRQCCSRDPGKWRKDGYGWQATPEVRATMQMYGYLPSSACLNSQEEFCYVTPIEDFLAKWDQDPLHRATIAEREPPTDHVLPGLGEVQTSTALSSTSQGARPASSAVISWESSLHLEKPTGAVSAPAANAISDFLAKGDQDPLHRATIVEREPPTDHVLPGLGEVQTSTALSSSSQGARLPSSAVISWESSLHLEKPTGAVSAPAAKAISDFLAKGDQDAGLKDTRSEGTTPEHRLPLSVIDSGRNGPGDQSKDLQWPRS